MANYRTRNAILGNNQQPGSARGSGDKDPSNRRLAKGTDPCYAQLDVTREDQVMNKLFGALAVFQNTDIEALKSLLLKSATATTTNGLFGKDSEIQRGERIDWQMKYRMLEIRHHELQQKYDTIDSEINSLKEGYHNMVTTKTTVKNEYEQQRSVLKKTEQELLEQKNEISRLKKHVESVNEESKLLKAQLQEKEMQQPNQTQGRNLNVEQLEMRHQDLHRKFDKTENESQAMMMDKIKLENENRKLSSMLRKTEEEFSQQKNEISRLKTHVESVDEESKFLKEQLQEKEMLLLKQKQERNWNVEHEQLEMRQNDLQKTFDNIKDECQTLKMDKTKLETENRKLSSMLRKTEEEFSKKTSEISRLKTRFESVDEESKTLKAQLQEKEMQLLKQKQGRNLNVEYEQLEMKHKDLQRKFDKIEDESQAIMMDKAKLKNENEKLSAVLRKTEQESLEQKSEISRLKKRIEKMDEESESFKAHLQEKERQLQEQRLATKKAYAEKDDALTRLSRHMGQQMSEGNPNITDLSDQNRPSKLGERYSELYDNEWTNAFEVLTDKFGNDIDDKSAIEMLRKILLESYKSAFDFSISQMKEAEYKLSGSTKGVGPECKRLLKEARKHIDIKRADSLLENVLEGTLCKVVNRRYLNETMVKVFATECFQLSWFMAIQDPPVVLAEDPIQGSRFDTNIYKHYTSSGDTVDYVVWPALLLHKGGPMLTKGVAQPIPKLKPKSAPASPLVEKKITDSWSFDKKSKSLYGYKVQDVTSAQGDPSSWRKLEYNPTPGRTFSSQGNTTPHQRLTETAIQFRLNQVLVNDDEVKNFERYCSWYPSCGAADLRKHFGTAFQRYNELYTLIKSGDDSYA